jgi:hypothetical protein
MSIPGIPAWVKDVVPWDDIADKFFAGAKTKDLGVLSEERVPLGGKIVRSAFLASKDGNTRLYIREKATSWLSWSVRYFYFDEEQVNKLFKAVQDAMDVLDKERQIELLQQENDRLRLEIDRLKQVTSSANVEPSTEPTR